MVLILESSALSRLSRIQIVQSLVYYAVMYSLFIKGKIRCSNLMQISNTVWEIKFDSSLSVRPQEKLLH